MRSSDFPFPVMVGQPYRMGAEPMPRLRDMKAKEVAALFGPFAVVFVLGLALRYSYPHTWHFSELVHLTGDAFAVAGIVGSVIEMHITGRLIDHTAESLSHRLIGWGLPSELQGEIRTIVDTTLVRFNTVKQYRLVDPRDGKVTVEVTYSFEVRNYGDAPEKYAPFLAEEEFYEPKFTYVEYGLIGKTGHTYSGSELEAMTETRADDRARAVNDENSGHPLPKVTIQPNRDHPDSVCRVSWQYRMTMPESYTDVTSFGGSAIGARVQADSIPDGFEFTGAGRYAVQSGQSGHTWTYTRPFLQHQHIRVRWFRQK
jgi:hypothetical protein